MQNQGPSRRSQKKTFPCKINSNKKGYENSKARNIYPADQLKSVEAHQFESDIPGYYYDKEKKNYFKILPNTLSSVSSFVTKETIKKQEAEKKRLSDLKKGSTVLPESFRSKKKENLNLLSVLRSVQCGQYTCENLQTYTIRQICCKLKPDRDWPNFCTSQPHLILDEIQKVEVTPSREKLICVSSVKSCLGQCIQLMKVTEEQSINSNERKSSNIAVRPSEVALGPVYKKISSLCLAPMQELPNATSVMYTTVCPVGYMPSVVNLCNLDAASTDSMLLFELNLGFKTVWSAAWDSQQRRFSIGSERKCHVIDVATRKSWTYSTHNSDPLAQIFSSDACNLLYNGTRAGLILVHDVRCQSRAQREMKQHFGVGCLKMLQNGSYILASDFSGTICMWDLRQQKVVVKYKGLVNSHYQLPFHLDETETLLSSSGSDSYSQIWDVKTGDLLKSLPPPYPVSIDSFPVSIYSQHWGNVPSNTGMIVAMKDKFVTYTTHF